MTLAVLKRGWGMQFEFDEPLGNQVVAATIVDELHRSGVRVATISPGSRSTPLALALASHPGIETRVILDERSAGFFALGAAKASGRPVAILVTSGTAATELTPAVTEAFFSQVPLIVLSADRPLELYDSGSAQTIDQSILYSGHLLLRRLIDAGAIGAWKRLRAVTSHAALTAAGLGGKRGPVQLNVSFREPLMRSGSVLPDPLPGRAQGAPWYEAVDLGDPRAAKRMARALLEVHRGLLIVGEVERDEAVFALSELLGWPTLVDPRSGLVRRSRLAVTHQDAIARLPEVEEHLAPELVLYLGRPQASRALSELLGRLAAPGGGSTIWRGGDGGNDPEGLARGFLLGPPERLVAALTELELETEVSVERGYVEAFLALDAACDATIAAMESDGELGVEIEVSRRLVDALGDADLLFSAASMPMRDLEFYAGTSEDYPRVLENRGANGIDGTIASFAGAALIHAEARPEGVSVLVIGDLAFVYDATFLKELAKLPERMLVVAVDNGGGGIFSLLPQRRLTAPQTFEALFGTPHGLDLVRLAAAYGMRASIATRAAEVSAAIADLRVGGPKAILVVHSERDANVEAHEILGRRLAQAMREVTARLP